MFAKTHIQTKVAYNGEAADYAITVNLDFNYILKYTQCIYSV